MKPRLWLAAVAAALVNCAPVSAHHENPVSGVDGFAAGFAHPWFGVDHLLAMVAVGLIAAQMRGRALWLLPAAFLGMMVAGGVLGMAGFQPPYVETCIAFSVAALGFALAWSRNYPLIVAAIAVGAFGLVHGLAHGAEMPALAAPALYATGFVLATALLHAAGILGGTCLVGAGHWEKLLRVSGAAIMCVGLLILSGIL